MRRFEELTIDKMLVARVKDGIYRYTYAEERRVLIELFDTSVDDKDVSVADILITEGFAKSSEPTLNLW